MVSFNCHVITTASFIMHTCIWGHKNHRGRRWANLCFSYLRFEFHVPKMHCCARKCYLPSEKNTLPHLFMPVLKVPLRCTIFVYLLAGWWNSSTVRSNLQSAEFRFSLHTGKQSFIVIWWSRTLFSSLWSSFVKYCCEHILVALMHIGLMLSRPSCTLGGSPRRLSEAVMLSFLKFPR